MEEAEPAADPSGSRKKQQNGDGGLKFCQMSSHGQFVGDDPCHMLEVQLQAEECHNVWFRATGCNLTFAARVLQHAPSSLRRWAWVLHLTSAGILCSPLYLTEGAHAVNWTLAAHSSLIDRPAEASRLQLAASSFLIS